MKNRAAQQLGRLGGKARAKNHTKEEIEAMSAKGGKKTAERGVEYYRELNRKSQQSKRMKKLTHS